MGNDFLVLATVVGNSVTGTLLGMNVSVKY
jgi:hypothetical protein